MYLYHKPRPYTDTKYIYVWHLRPFWLLAIISKLNSLHVLDHHTVHIKILVYASIMLDTISRHSHMVFYALTCVIFQPLLSEKFARCLMILCRSNCDQNYLVNSSLHLQCLIINKKWYQLITNYEDPIKII